MTEKIILTASTEEWSATINELAWMQTGPETAHITETMEAVDEAVMAACPGWFGEDGEIERFEDVSIELDEEKVSLVNNIIEEVRGCDGPSDI